MSSDTNVSGENFNHAVPVSFWFARPFLSEEQENQIRQLIDLILDVPDRKFEMKQIITRSPESSFYGFCQEGVMELCDIRCNTSACVLGWGMVMLKTLQTYEVEKMFGIDWDNYSSSLTNHEIWAFLFSSRWGNDKRQAVARLRKYVNMKEGERLYYTFESKF